MTAHLVDHDIVPHSEVPGVIYEKRPAKRADGSIVDGLYNAWIILDNPKQYNSYTTDMVKGVIHAFRDASVARDVVAVVFTGAYLMEKGRGFREDEKRKILDLQVHVARRILPLWRRLAERGQVILVTKKDMLSGDFFKVFVKGLSLPVGVWIHHIRRISSITITLISKAKPGYDRQE